MSMDQLFKLLTIYQSETACNQYREVHPELDRPVGAEVRRANLREYLGSFADASNILVGEAAGYAGCRFSGIPFTCEAQFAGPQRLQWAGHAHLARSSRAATPWVERSATMVWEVLDGRTDCVLWNAYPWHPFGAAGPLSNGKPGRSLPEGLAVLECLLSLFPTARVFAVGRVAERALASIGIEAPYIRHPSHGGKRRFQESVISLQPERESACQDRSVLVKGGDIEK